METKSLFVRKSPDFYRRTLILMAPVILQQLITIGINFMDNLMIGAFGETSIAAAAFGIRYIPSSSSSVWASAPAPW